jgi:lycopene cyclase domain-containing protein
MPLEEYLFFITIPYACTFIYETLEKFLTKPLLPAHTPKVLLLIVVVCGVMSFMLTHKIYTWSVLFGVAIITPLLLQIISGMKLQSFLLMYCIAIIPMLIVNGILTSLPVVIYNNNENLNLRIGSIPIEDFFYNFILMSMNIGLYELMKTRSLKKVLKRELPLVQLF